MGFFLSVRRKLFCFESCSMLHLSKTAPPTDPHEQQDLEEKIYKKFIRNSIKPMPLSSSSFPSSFFSAPTHAVPSNAGTYQIPSASDVFVPIPTSRPLSIHFPPPTSMGTTLTATDHDTRVSNNKTPIHLLTKEATTTPPPVPRMSLGSTTDAPRAPSPIDCLHICHHIKACPVCTQLYRPHDGIYLTVIAILVLVLLFLLKHLLLQLQKR